jgi:hypothetical protein
MSRTAEQIKRNPVIIAASAHEVERTGSYTLEPFEVRINSQVKKHPGVFIFSAESVYANGFVAIETMHGYAVTIRPTNKYLGEMVVVGIYNKNPDNLMNPKLRFIEVEPIPARHWDEIHKALWHEGFGAPEYAAKIPRTPETVQTGASV